MVGVSEGHKHRSADQYLGMQFAAVLNEKKQRIVQLEAELKKMRATAEPPGSAVSYLMISRASQVGSCRKHIVEGAKLTFSLGGCRIWVYNRRIRDRQG